MDENSKNSIGIETNSIKKTSSPKFKTIGQVFKYYREKDQLTIEEVAQNTYIKTKFLLALEDDSIDNLSLAPVYVFSFIKQYAKFLGLDENRILEFYRNNQEKVPSENFVIEPKTEKINSNLEIKTNLQNDLNKSKLPNTSTPPSITEKSNQPKVEPKIIEKDTQVKPKLVEKKIENTSEIDNKQAQDIINEAKSKAKLIIKRAEKQAERIITDAQEEAYELKQGAKYYSEQLLNKLEEQFIKALKTVRNGRLFIREKRKERTPDTFKNKVSQTADKLEKPPENQKAN